MISPQQHLMPAFTSAAFLLILATCSIGCASRNQIADLRLNAADYNQAFDASEEALRSAGYQLDRVDRRFGVITSQPKDAGSILEPWRDINATPEQALDATFNYQHRIIRITFLPASGLSTTPRTSPTSPSLNDNTVLAQIEPTNNQAATDLSTYQGTLRLNVQAVIERAHQPGRRIETTSLQRASYTIDPSLAQRGIPAKFWEVIARDPYQEQNIMKNIVRLSQNKLQVELVDRSNKK